MKYSRNFPKKYSRIFPKNDSRNSPNKIYELLVQNRTLRASDAPQYKLCFPAKTIKRPIKLTKIISLNKKLKIEAS